MYLILHLGLFQCYEQNIHHNVNNITYTLYIYIYI